MQSWTTQYKKLQGLTNNADTSVLAQFKEYLNESEKTMAGSNQGNWPFLEKQVVVPTIAGTFSYPVPNTLRKVRALRVLVGTTTYMPRPIEDTDFLTVVVSSNLGSSDVMQFYYLQDNQMQTYPTPASTGNSLIFIGRRKVVDRGFDDYTTGTVTTSTVNNVTTLAFTGSTLATWMGLGTAWIQLTAGDMQWYRISSVNVGANTAVLGQYYQGAAVTGSAFVIGQMPVIPEDYQDGIINRSLALYYENQKDKASAATYWRKYDGGVEAGLAPAGSMIGGILGTMIQDMGSKIEGAYMAPMDDIVIRNPNFPPTTIPSSNFN